MDKKNIAQPLYKRRSLITCMENALQILRSAWWRILKAAWIPLTVFAFGEALVTFGAGGQKIHSGVIGIGLLVLLIGWLSFFGLFYHWITVYKKSGEFDPSDFRRNLKPVLKQAIRFLAVHIPAGILTTILALFTLFPLLPFLNLKIGVNVSIWVGIVSGLVLVYLCIPLTIFCLDYLVGGSTYYKAFIKGLTMGTRRWGAFFALGFMVMILYWFVSMIVGLPTELSVIIEASNNLSMSDGNPYALPAFFPIVKFLLTCVVMFIVELISLYPLLSLILLYTSYETVLKERLDYEKCQKEQDKSKNV